MCLKPKKICGNHYKLWKNGEMEWDSAIAAGKTLRLSQGNISSCCLGKRNKCGNFKWKYKNEN